MESKTVNFCDWNPRSRIVGSLLFFSLGIVCLVGHPTTAHAQLKDFRVEVPAELPEHPRLFLNNQEIDELKAWIEREPWLKKFVDDFLTRTRERLDDVPLPPTEGNSERGGRNRHISTQANEFALAYVLTDERPFAEAAAEILLAYVPLYKNYPVTRTKGKAMSSTLDETRWAGDYATAYDLIYQSGVLSDDDKVAIEEEVLRPAGNVLRICNHHYRSNWRARALAGVGMVGFCINDRELIDEALNGYRDEEGRLLRDGFVQHVAWSLMSDGIFYERSFGYQSFTTDSYFLLMEAARHSGIDLWNLSVPSHPLDAGADIERTFGAAGPKTIKPMLDALFYRTFSDGSVPVVANAGNDDFFTGRYYEAAWRAYGDPKFAMAARLPRVARPWDKPQLSDRTRLRSPTELMWMEPDLPAGSFSLADDATIGRTGRHENACTLLPNGGYALLRQSAAADAVGVGMTFGRWGSGHSHADKLSIVVSDGRRKAIREVKYFGYGAKKYLTWDRQTIAHNTVTVDEKSQAPQGDGDDEWAIPSGGNVVRGRPLMFHPGERLKVFRADCEDAYEGVRLERTVVLIDGVLVDFFRCQSDQQHTYDYALHVDGEFANHAPDEPGPLSEAYGYRHITELRHATAPAVMSFKPQGHVRVLSPGEITTARGIKGKGGKQRSVLVVRQEGQNVAFVSVIDFGEQATAAEQLETANDGEQVVSLGGGLKVINSPRGVTLTDEEGTLIEQARLARP